LIKSFIFFIFCSFSSVYLHADEIHVDPQTEIAILRSLDIDPSFVNDIHYLTTKEHIDELKKIYFLKTLKRGNLFMPNLQELLGEADIPNTFLYMAMVESKFLADSKSHKHAAGLWQFMPATAKEYNLARNGHVDERLDPIKSTKAAIAYLKYLHERFHKWYLAAMAYNCGEGRLAQAIKKAGTDDLAVLIDEDQAYLPKETRDYIQRIIVAALLAHDKKIIKQNNKNHLFGYCTNKKLVKLYFKGGQSLKKIAVKIGVPYKKLKACNPHLIKNSLPPNPKKLYYLYLPEDLAQKAKTEIKESDESFVYHVQPNDTLFLISKRFNIKMSALKMLNPQLKKHKVLKIGMPLTILGKPAKKQKEKNPKVLKNRIETYTVEHNSTLYELSIKFNNKIATLKKLNPGIKDLVTEGTKIKVVRDVNITTIEHNRTKNFKTVVINRDQNRSQETNLTKEQNGSKEENRTRSDNNSTVPLAKRKAADTADPSIKKIPTYRTVTYKISGGESLEKIAEEFNLTVKDLLKPGNVMIIKIKPSDQNRTYAKQDENNKTEPPKKHISH
jgi:membrane-bound lytic murein transglycosylase D